MKDIYWLIDLNDLENISSKLYGYMVSDDGKILQHVIPDSIYYTGCFTLIKNTDNNITIFLDFYGCQGIYKYEYNEFVVFSNGFYELVKYVKSKNLPLSLNNDYIHNYLFQRDLPFSYYKTLVNEITCLRRDSYITINKQDSSYSINVIDYEENSIDICNDTEKALAVLDTWFYKWVNVFRNIAKEKNYILFDLSGGFDSRISFGMVLNSNIDKSLYNIRMINAKNSNFAKSNDDAEISNKIMTYYNLLDYTSLTAKTKLKESENIYNISINTKLPQAPYNSGILEKYYDVPFYHVTGYFGECIHEYNEDRFDVWTKNQLYGDLSYFKKHYDIDLNESSYFKEYEYVKNALNDLQDIRTLYPYVNDSEYNYNMITKHLFSSKVCGRKFSMIYNLNQIALSPFSDPLINKFKLSYNGVRSSSLLHALIFSRYFPELAYFPIQNNRNIPNELINIADDINQKYPFVKKELPLITSENPVKLLETGYKSSMQIFNTVKEFIINNKQLVIDNFDEVIYDVCIKELEESDDKNPLKASRLVLGIYYVLQLKQIIN